MAKRKRQSSDAVTASKRTLRAQTKVKAANTDEQTSAFLVLPPELRNRIYEYALIKPYNITVDVHLQIPPLLDVSRQIKKEASGIWYESNRFSHYIQDCNAMLLQRFTKHCKNTGMKARDQLEIYETPNWPNLVKWCKQVHAHNSKCLPQGAGFSAVETVISSAHGIAIETKDQPWEKCEALLKILRRTVGRYDKRWLD
ncbi:hypothetical protein LTR97_001077 [Elasticomyces elasticus]|uniref:Uncharacterized protein n=1 Tax=Elasticomyces elasticus TaxID=574655 RepID=A0AAN8A4W2_9PEZI|nr:hypothetical protein LTR97_001077 [Elasticomyces elasticus]KAK5723756.1 hypothetical protein LTR15_005456 [Elasticomyces elasticus]